MSPATRAPDALTAMKLEVCGQPAHNTGGRTSGYCSVQVALGR